MLLNIKLNRRVKINKICIFFYTNASSYLLTTLFGSLWISNLKNNYNTYFKHLFVKYQTPSDHCTMHIFFGDPSAVAAVWPPPTGNENRSTGQEEEPPRHLAN